MTKQDKAAIIAKAEDARASVQHNAYCGPTATVIARADLANLLALAKLGASLDDEGTVERVARALAHNGGMISSDWRPFARAAIDAIRGETG